MPIFKTFSPQSRPEKHTPAPLYLHPNSTQTPSRRLLFCSIWKPLPPFNPGYLLHRYSLVTLYRNLKRGYNNARRMGD